MEIKLGSKYKDKITGFSGVAIARTEWLNGCARITLQPADLDKDGKVKDTQTFDDLQLVLAEEIKHEPKRATGGPRPDVAKQRA